MTQQHEIDFYLFINGITTDKSVGEIVAINRIKNILLSYNIYLYINYHRRFEDNLFEYMFKNRKKRKGYSWINAVDDIHSKYKKNYWYF